MLLSRDPAQMETDSAAALGYILRFGISNKPSREASAGDPGGHPVSCMQRHLCLAVCGSRGLMHLKAQEATTSYGRLRVKGVPRGASEMQLFSQFLKSKFILPWQPALRGES